jgi:hypothetical protein
MTHVRMKDWEPRLVAYLAGIKARTFAPGAHDCALFTAGAVAAMTSIDHAEGWRGRYKTLKGGQRALKKAGIADHVALVASLFDEVAPAFAHRGDIAVVAGADGIAALGIVQGEGVYVLKPEGLAVIRRSEMKRAFRV